MKLSEEEREAALRAMPGWTYEGGSGGGAISRSFRFRDFTEAFAFMTRVALIAEKADHHPDWSNSWNKVAVSLSTHSAGGVTEKDIKLARSMDGFAGGLP